MIDDFTASPRHSGTETPKTSGMRRGRVFRAKVLVIEGECQYGWYGQLADVRVGIVILSELMCASEQATTSQPLHPRLETEVEARIHSSTCR
jgi:hypothetical protein